MARSIWAGSHVLLMRQPSVHSHLCARQELPDGERPISVADQLVREWHGYRSLLVANGFNVCHLPEVEGEGRESADAQFVRDGMTVTPAGNIIFSRFAPQSKHRQAETDCYSGLFDRGWLEQFGISSGAARLLPAEDETFEGGDIEFFKVKGRWVAVIGLSARTNRGGVERVSDFLRTEGVSSVVIPVRRENSSGARIPAMHWTTHGQRI